MRRGWRCSPDARSWTAPRRHTSADTWCASFRRRARRSSSSVWGVASRGASRASTEARTAQQTDLSGQTLAFCKNHRMMGSERTAVVVEDDDDIRELITHSLTMQGFAVAAASSGQAGIELVVANDPDLVTLDLGLPDLDGIEVCRRVRDVSQAYVVMISARTDEIDRLMGLEIGADDYLTKPFSPRELQARVNAMFRRPRTGGSNGVTETPGPGAKAAPPTADPSAAEGARVEVAHSLVRHGRIAVDPEGRVV